MKRIFLTKTLRECSINPYRVTWVSEHTFESERRKDETEITQYFENWQHPTIEELEYFNIVHGELALEAYGFFLDAFREVLKRVMKDKGSYE